MGDMLSSPVALVVDRVHQVHCGGVVMEMEVE